MTITLFPRSLPLHRPFRSSGWEISAREIILVRIEDAEGRSGWGESAPLESFGTESRAAALRMLEHVASGVPIREAGDTASQLAVIEAAHPALAETPTARFALESALLDLAARERGIPLTVQLGGDGLRRKLPVNAVIGGGSPEQAAASAKEAVAQGYRCVKLKVGAPDPAVDAERIRAVREAIPPDVLLRLDANGAWEFGTAEEALRMFQPYDIEYIEQPVPAGDVDELAALTGLRILPVAADEAAQSEVLARALLRRRAVDLFVIKPMAFGGLVRARQFAMDAHAAGVDVVFTSLIDSAVGRSAVAHLCASLPFPLRPQGLATGMLFAVDTARDEISEGQLQLSGGAGLGVLPRTGES
jgi:o-succinylbenzoate synthase